MFCFGKKDKDSEQDKPEKRNWREQLKDAPEVEIPEETEKDRKEIKRRTGL